MSVSRSKSKEKQGLTLDVSFSEVSVLWRCLFKLKTCLSYRGVHFRVFIKHMTKLPNKVSYHSSSPSSFFLINNKRGCKLRTHSGFQKDWYVKSQGCSLPYKDSDQERGGGVGGKLLPNILLK